MHSQSRRLSPGLSRLGRRLGSLLELEWPVGRSEIDPKHFGHLFVPFRRDALSQETEQILLSGLAENAPVERQGAPERLEALSISAQREGWHVALDDGWLPPIGKVSWPIDPEGPQL